MFSWTSSFTRSSFSSVLFFDTHPEHSASSTEVTPFFNLENRSETFVLLICCSTRHTLNISKVQSPKQCLMQILFQVCHILCTQKSQTEQHILVPNKILHNSHMCNNLIPSRKGLCKLCLHLAVELHASSSSAISQSRNYLITPCIVKLYI